MTNKRVAGKMGKWIPIAKALPDGDYPCLVYLDFPNSQKHVGVARVSYDQFKFEYIIPAIPNLDLSLSSEQESLNRYARSWQKIELPT